MKALLIPSHWFFGLTESSIAPKSFTLVPAVVHEPREFLNSDRKPTDLEFIEIDPKIRLLDWRLAAICRLRGNLLIPAAMKRAIVSPEGATVFAIEECLLYADLPSPSPRPLPCRRAAIGAESSTTSPAPAIPSMAPRRHPP